MKILYLPNDKYEQQQDEPVATRQLAGRFGFIPNQNKMKGFSDEMSDKIGK